MSPMGLPVTQQSDLPCFENSKKWLFLSICSLLTGGLLSLVLVMGRAPIVNQFINDPLFAKRVLVVHVTLTLTCWFFGYISTLYYLLPGSKMGAKRVYLALLGIALFVIGGMIPGSQPILSNYIPIIHQPLFLTGALCFIFAIGLSFFDKRLFTKFKASQSNSILDFGSVLGIKTAVVTVSFGILVLIYSILVTPKTDDLFSYYEILFWGCGHLFQLANISGMIAVWLILYKRAFGESLLSNTSAYVIFCMILLPALVSPILLMDGTSGESYYTGFTLIMRWGTWPSAAIVLFAIVKKFLTLPSERKKQVFHSAEFVGLMASSALLLLGFYLGAMINMSSTLIPAHYHATIGSVTVSYLVVTYVLLKEMGYKHHSQNVVKWIKRQPIVFATGQFIFSLGFAYAGLHGLGRKVYGGEQLVSKSEQYVGLGIMGTGGVLAIFGGALFFVVIYKMIKANTNK